MKAQILTLAVLIFVLIFSSCTKEDFTRTTVSTEEKVEPVKFEEVSGCSSYSPPPLDILILYDNSTSLYFFKRNVKSAIRELVAKIGNFKDFNICIAPLVYQGDPSKEFKCQNYVTTSGNVPLSLADVHVGANGVIIDGVTTNVYIEKGFERVYQFVKNNKVSAPVVSPVFRDNAVTVAIVVSNGDDTDVCRDSWGNVSECGKINHWSSQIMSLKTELSLKQIRYFSVINSGAVSTCSGTSRYSGERYKLLSKIIYNSQGLSTDNRSSADSYDLCTVDLNVIFSQIASSIDQYKVGHIYNSWPVGNMTGKDPAKLKVWKGINKTPLTLGDINNGFVYDPSTGSKNIREFPAVSSISPAENAVGPFINLFGSAKVTYPECLYIKKEDFTKYYGYIVLPDEPDLNHLKVIIDGKEIAQDNTNGWGYMGFKPSVYLLVKSPQDLSPGPIPPEGATKYFKSGYVIKLFGSAVYTDGAKIEVLYKKAKQI